jgi:hypothetical protein
MTRALALDLNCGRGKEVNICIFVLEVFPKKSIMPTMRNMTILKMATTVREGSEAVRSGAQSYARIPPADFSFSGGSMQKHGNRFKDLTGQTFGKLKVLEFGGTIKKKTLWNCMCACGKKVKVKANNLQSGTSKTCGCQGGGWKHGMSKSRVYGIWEQMLQRCRNPNGGKFKYYGGRGIKVCPEWHDPVIFKEWAFANGYCDNLTIDRINNNGNYEPNNCQWITLSENIKKSNSERKSKVRPG